MNLRPPCPMCLTVRALVIWTVILAILYTLAAFAGIAIAEVIHWLFRTR